MMVWRGSVHVYIHALMRGGVGFMTFITIFICSGLIGMCVYLKTMPCISNDIVVCCVRD